MASTRATFSARVPLGTPAPRQRDRKRNRQRRRIGRGSPMKRRGRRLARARDAEDTQRAMGDARRSVPRGRLRPTPTMRPSPLGASQVAGTRAVSRPSSPRASPNPTCEEKTSPTVTEHAREVGGRWCSDGLRRARAGLAKRGRENRTQKVGEKIERLDGIGTGSGGRMTVGVLHGGGPPRRLGGGADGEALEQDRAEKASALNRSEKRNMVQHSPDNNITI